MQFFVGSEGYVLSCVETSFKNQVFKNFGKLIKTCWTEKRLV